MRVVRAVAQGGGNFQQLPIFNSSWFGTLATKTRGGDWWKANVVVYFRREAFWGKVKTNRQTSLGIIHFDIV